MITVNSEVKNYDGKTKTVQVDLFADTKDEVESTELTDIIGLPKGATLEMGSTVITANGEKALLKSDGTWVWQKSGGGGGGTSDYNDLDNKPSINGVTLEGNLTADDLGLSGLQVDYTEDTLVFTN